MKTNFYTHDFRYFFTLDFFIVKNPPTTDNIFLFLGGLLPFKKYYFSIKESKFFCFIAKNPVYLNLQSFMAAEYFSSNHT